MPVVPTVPAAEVVTRPVGPRPQAADDRRLGRRRPRAAAVGAVLLLLLGVAAWAGWLGLDARQARADLGSAATAVAHLRVQVLTGDRTGARATLVALQADATSAQSRTHGPHWTVAGALPGVGATVSAVQTVSEVVTDLALDALPGLLTATALTDPAGLALVDGRVDLAAFTRTAPGVVAADDVVQHALGRVRAIDADAVLPVVADQLAVLDRELTDVAATTATAARAVRLLPPMLGADGPRDYLLLVQNNAELRATGGIPGAVVLLRVDAGAVQVVGQRSGGSLGNLSAPVVPLTTAEAALFGEDLAADMRDVTFTPDFPRSGQIARAIWHQEVGDEVDGVLSIDPGALAHVLAATGPVDLGGRGLPRVHALTAQNVVSTLLNGVYLDVPDPDGQDAFFAAAAAAVFGAVVSGQGDATSTVAALATAAGEGRLMLWSAHPAEQALLAGTVLGGALRGVRGDSPVVGVYLNDAIPAKMGYYLRSDVTAVPTGCTPDGDRTVTVTVDLTSTAPADAASLPGYVTGTETGFPRGTCGPTFSCTRRRVGGWRACGSTAPRRASSPRRTTVSGWSAGPSSWPRAGARASRTTSSRGRASPAPPWCAPRPRSAHARPWSTGPNAHDGAGGTDRTGIEQVVPPPPPWSSTVIRRTALASAAAVALVLAPTAAWAYDAPGYTSGVTDATPAAGAPIVVAVDGDPAIAGRTVLLTVTSTPASLPNSAIQIAGTATASRVADAQGAVRFTVVLSEPGSYSAVATVDGAAVSTMDLAVTPATTTTVAAAGGSLARTGLDGAGLATGAGVLVVAGAGAVLVARRRQAAV